MVARQGVVEISDEIIPVVFRKTHKGSSHDNELNFINRVAELLKLRKGNKIRRKMTNLIDSIADLHVGIVSSSNRSHGSRFFTGVRLRRIIEFRIWTSWTISNRAENVKRIMNLHANISRHGYVRTSVGFAHHSHNNNLRKGLNFS